MRTPAPSNLRGLSLQGGREMLRLWLMPGEASATNNRLNLYRDIAWYGVLSGVSTTFTSVFALRLGGANVLIGLLSSLPALVNVIFQIPAARLIERQADRRRVLLVSGFLMRLPVLLVAMVPLLFRAAQAEAVVYITALGTIPAAVSNVAFTAMLADVVAPSERARVVSVRNALLSAVTMVTVFAAGEALDVFPFPINYQLIFTLAFAASLLSLYYLGRVVMPPAALPSTTVQRGRTDLRRWLRSIMAHQNYVRFVLGSFVYHWGLHFPIPLYTIYRVRELRITEGWIGTLSMVEAAVTMVFYYVWGKIAERQGTRRTLIFGLLGVCFYPLGTALSRSVWPLLLVSAVAGFVGPAFNLGLFNGLLEVAAAEQRATYVAIFNTLMNIAAFTAPLLGTALAGLVGTRTALFVGAGLRLVGFAVFSRLLRAPSISGHSPNQPSA